jgi:hypothetical protein
VETIAYYFLLSSLPTLRNKGGSNSIFICAYPLQHFINLSGMYELVYCSIANPDARSKDIADILRTSRDFNSKNDITGCLLYYNGEFIQVLEGDQNIIQDLFSRIENDDRHSNVVVLAAGDKEKRVFNDWNMAYHELNKDDVQEIGKDVFAENFLAFSDFAEKGTFPMIVFWSNVRLLLKKVTNIPDN